MSEKLKKTIENMSKDDLINSFITVYEDSIKKDLEIERLNNIIKEVREYITSQKLHKFQDTTGGLTYQERKLLEILDKGE